MKSETKSGIKFVMLIMAALIFVISGVGCLASAFMTTHQLAVTCGISFAVVVIMILVEIFSQSKYPENNGHSNSSEV